MNDSIDTSSLKTKPIKYDDNKIFQNTPSKQGSQQQQPIVDLSMLDNFYDELDKSLREGAYENSVRGSIANRNIRVANESKV